MVTLEYVKNVLLAGFGRFLSEMPPSWSAKGVEGIIRSLRPDLTLQSEEVQRLLRELVADKTIHLVGRTEVYLLLTEDFILQNTEGVYREFQLKQIRERMSEWLKEILTAGFRRFLYEMPPYWSRDNFHKLYQGLIPGASLDDPRIKLVVNELVREEVVYFVGKDEIYLLLTESFVRNHSTDFTQKTLLEEVEQLKQLHHPLPHQP